MNINRSRPATEQGECVMTSFIKKKSHNDIIIKIEIKRKKVLRMRMHHHIK